MLARILGSLGGFSLVRKSVLPATRLFTQLLESRDKLVINFQEPHRRQILDLVRRIKAERLFLLDFNEAYQLANAVISTAKVPGDIIEVGVFQGSSAKMISELRGDRRLHLCDTFAGLPETSALDSRFAQGSYSCSLDSVRKYLNGYQNLQYHQGLFPASADAALRDTRFSLAHLDVDLYESTKGSLGFLYPRMSPGGVIISHDYVQAEGVHQAFTEFFADKPEPVFELTGTQCMVVKLESAAPDTRAAPGLAKTRTENR